MAKFKFSSTESFNYETPQEMFDDYKNKNITSIYDYQSKIIDLYLKEEDSNSDIALELPTGTGKTLVGLLIGEFFRRKNKEKILYLCPNNQLVYQTVKHANDDYGINATAFTGTASSYTQNDKALYTTAKTIAVTTYSSLFNSNPFFTDADIIIFDDAHSGESYVASNWTVTINSEQDKILFENLVDLFKQFVNKDVYEKMIYSDEYKDLNWYDKVPNIKLIGNYTCIKNTINTYLKENTTSKIIYSWSMIKDHLSACNIFLSLNEIVIRPFIPPTLSFSPFKNARRRIYMSATLGKSGELERSFGIDKIKKLQMVKDWENKTIGRRFFLFPFVSFKENELSNIILKLIEKTNRTLIIVNDNKTQDIFIKFIKNNTKKEVYTAKDIEKSKDKFIKSSNAVAVVSNRFDGIDFPGDECHLQILFDLQTATHIQEKFLTNRMCSQVLFTERINSRLVQALGRCTRSNKDYAAVCIVGEELMNTLIAPKKKLQFNPELQAELEFGFNNSTGYTDIDDYLELLDIFLNNRKEWNPAEKDIINIRDNIIDKNVKIDEVPYEQLYKCCQYEVKAQYNLWREDYENAFKYSQKVCNVLTHDSVKGYLGFWLYISAYCAYNIYVQGDASYKNLCIKLLKKASNTTLSIKWFNQLIKDSESVDNNEIYMEYVIERIEQKISKAINKNTNKKIFENFDVLLENLKGLDGKKFERAHEELGQWIGYRTFNPKGDSEPDPIWILNSQFCIVSEDKIYETDAKAIPTRHVREAAGHKNWISAHCREDSLKMAEQFECITVFISNSNTIDEPSAIQAKGIYYLNRNELVKYAERCISVLKELVISFNAIGDIVWREKAMKTIIENGLTPNEYIDMIKRNELEKL